jgi:DNA-binding cell septation regulator SpoVG
MQITEVQIIPIKPNNGLVAIASVVVGKVLFIGFIGIHTKLNGQGYRITYPTKVVSGRSFNMFHPIHRDFALTLEQAVLAKAEEVLSYQNKKRNDHVGHSNTNDTERVLSDI